MRAVLVREPGGVEVLSLGDAPDPVPGEGELLVRVRAAGLNRADLLQRMGRYPPPAGASSLLGLELAGEVVRGAGAFAPGDRVMSLVPGGAYAELATAPAATTLPVPAGLSWAEAAAIPEAFLTAWLNLFDLGGLASGETVLVHAGASGVGAAAIQLARARGATVITTAGSEAKLDFCRELGAAHTIHRHTEDFAARVEEITGGAGVALVLDVVGQPYWERNLRALARGGRLVLVGFLGGSRGEADLGPVLRKSLTVRGTTLRGTPDEQKAALVRELGEFALPRFKAGELKPTVDRLFPWDEVAAAHTYMAENRNLGKIVLEMS